MLKVRPTAAGHNLRVRLPAGTSVGDLENVAEVAAAAMGVAGVRVARDPQRASMATVAVIRREPTLTRSFTVGLGGIEPPTSALSVPCPPLTDVSLICGDAVT